MVLIFMPGELVINTAPFTLHKQNITVQIQILGSVHLIFMVQWKLQNSGYKQYKKLEKKMRHRISAWMEYVLV